LKNLNRVLKVLRSDNFLNNTWSMSKEKLPSSSSSKVLYYSKQANAVRKNVSNYWIIVQPSFFHRLPLRDHNYFFNAIIYHCFWIEYNNTSQHPTRPTDADRTALSCPAFRFNCLILKHRHGSLLDCSCQLIDYCI